MHGLTVRWSLENAPEGVEEALSDYVEATSHPKFTGRPGLRLSTSSCVGTRFTLRVTLTQCPSGENV